MPWTASARRQYARTATRYTTDLTDTDFALIVPPLPAPSRLGRPRTVDLREVLNAILYLLRSGCPWDLLPKELPAKSTVFGYFRRWRFPWLRLIFADGGYQGETAACAAAQERLRLQIVKREPGSHGFAVLPKRWLVERTFAWFGRIRSSFNPLSLPVPRQQPVELVDFDPTQDHALGRVSQPRLRLYPVDLGSAD